MDSASHLISGMLKTIGIPVRLGHNSHNPIAASFQEIDARWLDTLNLILGGAVCLYVAKYVVDQMQDVMSNTGDKGNMAALQSQLAEKLGRPDILNMTFDQYESAIMNDVMCPDDIEVTFDSIGGMESELETIEENICAPMQLAKNYADFQSIAPMPTGALLYGPPGTGKTLSARAIAKESGATFVGIKSSTMMSKWFGESNKMITALFSLARKLAPSVIFLDEVDTLLGNRGDQHSTAHNSMLGHMLAEWDGLTGSQYPVIVLGTTNRPHDLDKAFLRRMPLMIKTSVPNYEGRIAILKKLLRHETLADDVNIGVLALNTTNYSGSDLREFTRLATTARAKEIVQITKKHMADAMVGRKKLPPSYKPPVIEVRPLNGKDFQDALSKARCTGDEAFDYAEETLLDESKRQQEMYEKVAATLMKLSKPKNQPAPGCELD
jgi:ATPase family AAA domain-containing protein 1